MIDKKRLIEGLEYYISHTTEKMPEHYAYIQCKELIEKQPKAGGWIPITKTMKPPRFTNVLVQTKDGFITVGTWINYKDGSKPRFVTHADEDYDVGKIVAWMPLPKPYKE